MRRDPVAAEQVWRELAAGVLRRGHPEVTIDTVRELLTRTTVEGLGVPVLGTAATGGPPPPSPVPTTGRTGWYVRALVILTDPVTAAAQVRRELAGGATSVWLRVAPGTSAAVLRQCLDALPLSGLTLVVDADDCLPAVGALRAVIDVGSGPAADSVVGVDPFAAAVRSGGQPLPADRITAAVRETSSAAADLGVRSLTVDGAAAHDAGAGDVGELGWALAVGVALLREMTAAGTDVAAALNRLELRLAASAQLYPTIAKFRAARLLWARVAQVCGVPGADASLHAVTSRPLLTRRDAETNLLRTTLAAFAAGAGGADAVTVLPYDDALREPDASSRRWARNISHLLLAESHVGQTVDPAAGSFAVEELTAALAAAAWSEFQLIEAAGGARAALTDGSVAQRWDRTATERERRISDGRQPLIGVTVHPTAGPAGPGTGDRPPVPGWPAVRNWEPTTAVDDRSDS